MNKLRGCTASAHGLTACTATTIGIVMRRDLPRPHPNKSVRMPSPKHLLVMATFTNTETFEDTQEGLVSGLIEQFFFEA